MPAVHFCVRWPDGREERCYSPSTVIFNAFQAGDEMPLSEFMQRADRVLNEASERVRSVYGYSCSSAADQLTLLKRRAAAFEDQGGPITVLSMTEIPK